MTKDASFKKVVRRHAEETGQRYTEALTDLEGLGARMHHEPVPERLLAHLRDRYGIDPIAATKLSVHKSYVFRIDRNDGTPWVARAFPPARPRAGVEGDAAILGFLERQDYPAERLAADDAVSDLDGSAVLVTRFVEGVRLPDGAAKFAMMGELLGRLHALPYDDSVGRPGGASGEDPSREGTPRQDLLAALSFLDAVDTKVSAAERARFEQLRDQVRAADDGHGLPDGLLHGNLLHAPDHAVLSEQGPVAINWKASGRGPRLADLAYLIWGTGSWNPRQPDQERIDAAVNAYRRHVEPTDDELDRLEAVMYIRTLYLACFGYRRALTNGWTFNEWGFIEPPEYFRSTAAATRAAFRRLGGRVSAPVEVPEDTAARVYIHARAALARSGSCGCRRGKLGFRSAALHPRTGTPASSLNRTGEKKGETMADPWPWPESMDAPHAAPTSHRVLLDNDRVRVLEVVIEPGAREPEHTHRAASVMIVDEPARIRYYQGAAPQFESRARSGSPPGVRVRWMEPEGPHSVENIDERRYHAIRVELK